MTGVSVYWVHDPDSGRLLDITADADAAERHSVEHDRHVFAEVLEAEA